MKKKAAILTAVLIMAGSAVYAEESTAKEEKKSDSVFSLTKWDFTGSNVEFKAYLHNSEKGVMYAGKDEDFVISAKRQLDEKTFLQFGYNTDDNVDGGSNPDYELELLVNRKFNDKVEAQMDISVITGDESGAGKGFRVKEDFDSDKVYIKYKVNSSLALKFNPFDIDLTVGDEFKTINEQKTPGVQAEYKFSDSIKMYAGAGFGMYVKDSDGDGEYDKLDNIKNGDGDDVTVLGLKAGVKKEWESGYLTGQFSTNTQDDEDIKEKCAVPLQTALSVAAGYKKGNINIKTEGLYTKLNKSSTLAKSYSLAESESGIALMGKAKYTIGNNTPYIQGMYIGEYAYFNDDDYCALIADGDGENHGGMLSLIVGDEYKLTGNLKIIPYIEYRDAANKIFKDDGEDNASDSALYFVTKIKAEF